MKHDSSEQIEESPKFPRTAIEHTHTSLVQWRQEQMVVVAVAKKWSWLSSTSETVNFD